MDHYWNGESEDRDSDAEGVALRIDHIVMALHGAQRRFDHRAAGVLKFAAWLDMGLLADHTFALHFRFAAISIGDQPVAT